MTGWHGRTREGVNQHISGILARSRVALFLVPFGRIPVLDKGKDCPYVAFTKLFLFPGDKELEVLSVDDEVASCAHDVCVVWQWP